MSTMKLHRKAERHALKAARRHAAASVQWPEKTPFLLNPDPVLRRRLDRVVLAVCVLLVLWAMGSSPNGPLADLWRAREAREQRPAMEKAMQAGNRTASTWLALHFPEDYPTVLQRMANEGEPKAMFFLGGYMMMDDPKDSRFLRIDPSLSASERKAKGLEIMRKAAAAGSEEALRYLIKYGLV
ncbi:hypothetical protein [Cupriavidus pauculus]|uniref:hypothetical protein n=1 Tax=Cupriavidus pauculus TaxID=82633 RepID=UPI0038579A91